MAADPYSAIGGALIGGIGTIFGANAARTQKNQLRDLANTPGLDIDTEIANALAGYQQSLPGATKVSAGVNQANADALRAMLESGIPGYGDLQKQVISNISSGLRGELDPDVQALLNRTTAAKSYGSGGGGFFSGGQADDLNLLDFGLTSMKRKSDAEKEYLSLLAGTPLPGLFGAQSLIGPSITDRLGIRQNERTQRLNLLGQSIGAPSSDQVIANYLQTTGGALMGVGAQGGFGGGNNFSSTSRNNGLSRSSVFG